VSTRNGTPRTCSNGHQYIKSSDCPTCPFCEAERKPTEGFLSLLAAPARRALEGAGITTLQQLSRMSKINLLALHRFGPSSLPILEKALKKKNLSFKKD